MVIRQSQIGFRPTLFRLLFRSRVALNLILFFQLQLAFDLLFNQFHFLLHMQLLQTLFHLILLSIESKKPLDRLSLVRLRVIILKLKRALNI